MSTEAIQGQSATEPGSVAFALGDLHAYYGSSHVVKGLNFEVGRGHGMAILGRNGAGKSTTLRSGMGLLAKTTGTVMLNGTDVQRESPYKRARRGLALVFEDRRIFPGLTVTQNLEVPSQKTASKQLALDDVYDMFPLLAGMRTRDAGRLSGGEQQMLAIARAVRARPSVLLLDEPSEGLAPRIVEDLVDTIKDLRRQLSLTIVVAEHKQWFSREVTETVGVLASESGTMVFQGRWDEFDAHPEVAERYLSLGTNHD
ncbi:amino acid/amide ABC transporter ATP-binding protein 2 (HAAT family) [Blastococcus colisei]|uniref:Amino acid/amide ABC transporter ATP-binding protein 2 (HAAT family) n=1 Tax=Blastococcus colisei TaxID=1564162 RepID=A0A543PFE9_9ACTN|nr:ABC transporter ATP-binding protein [Blastococcus colisei]TQN42804.1 amino acid/amide ABC transporter ATP-binding protein 2 (HAAT family) [Blastococcus colisei]